MWPHCAYYALYALQHRGQESAGIVVNDDGLFTSYRDVGLVNEVFHAGAAGPLWARATSPSAMCAMAPPAATTTATPSPFW